MDSNEFEKRLEHLKKSSQNINNKKENQECLSQILDREKETNIKWQN